MAFGKVGWLGNLGGVVYTLFKRLNVNVLSKPPLSAPNSYSFAPILYFFLNYFLKNEKFI